MVQEIEEPNNDREAAVDQRDRLKRLTSSSEWGMVLAFIKSQCEMRTREVMRTPQTADNSTKIEHMKGEFSGMLLVKEHIESLVGEAEDLVELFKEDARRRSGERDAA